MGVQSDSGPTCEAKAKARHGRRSRTVCRRAPASFVGMMVMSALLLAGCGVRSGYPNHVPTASLVEPGTSPRDNKDVYLQLIRKMQQQGAYYASLAHIDAYRLRYGDPPQLRRLRADALRETGQGSAAAAVYRGLVHSDQAAAAWHGLGLIAAHDGDHAQAEQDLQKAVALKPIDAAYLSDLGYARLCAGDVLAAHEPLAKAAQLAPSDTKALANLALWSLLDNNPQQADAIMRGAKLTQPTRDAIYRLATQLRVASARNASVTATTAPDARPPHRLPVSAGISGIPGGVLDRFGPNSSTQGTNP